MARWDFRLLGLILLYCGCGVSAENIDVSIHGGNVGQVVSYNYPFVYNKAEYKEFNYRIFSNPLSGESICLEFHRFDMRDGGTLTIYSGYGSGTYDNKGELRSGSGIFPSDVWLKVFCVPLMDGKDYLEVTFRHYGDNVRGFQFDYWATSMYNISQVHPSPQENYLTGIFICYNRKYVLLRDMCDNVNDCGDLTDETFAHAQCTDVSGTPRQRPGIWACNFDGGVCSSDMVIKSYNGWKTASSVASDEEGPRTDHTYSSSGHRGKFVYTDFDDWIREANLWFDPDIPGTQGYCLSFWYFMGGNDPGKLSVGWKYRKRLWHRIGSFGSTWLHGQVYLKPEAYYSQVEFVAERGSQAGSRISLDDISVLPGLCPFTDGSLTSPGWDFGDCTNYTSTNNSIRCNNKDNVSVVLSPIIASGKCLVLSVRFPSRSTTYAPYIKVYQHTLGEPSRYIGDITQPGYSRSEKIKKFTISSKNPFQIRLRLSNRGRGTIVDNFYVVDNDCNNLSLGSCDIDEFYCSQGECITSAMRCDGFRDCDNGQDEKDCTHTFPGVTLATGLIGACIFILLGLTCTLYSINKKSTQRAQEARVRRNEEMSTRDQMFLVEDWEQGANPGFPFDDPDSLPPSYNDCVANGVVVPRGAAEGDDTADSTSLPPYDDFLTGSFVELNPTTLKPVNQPNE